MQEHLSGDYQSYLLRIWRSEPGSPWRASLQSTATGTVTSFNCMEEALAHLQAVTQKATSKSHDGHLAE